MNIHFITPDANKSQGGIDNAVLGLAEALEATGKAHVTLPERMARGRSAFGNQNSTAPDITHFHGLWNPSHAKLSKQYRKNGQPYVVSPHGMLEPWAWRNRLWKKLPYFHFVEKTHLRGASSIIVTSPLEKTNLTRHLTHPHVHAIPLGCQDPQPPDYSNARATLGWPSDQRVLLYLSRIDRKKCIDRLLQALAKIPDDLNGWRVVIVGDGDPTYLQELKKLADQLSDRLPPIHWAGGVWGDKRWPYLQGADLFCLPTYSENFGIAVLEALHAGTPVLTTDQTPWADLATSSGITISTTDVDSMTAALTTATTDAKWWSADSRQQLVDLANDRFAWSKLAQSYLEAYRQSLKLRSR